MTAPPIDIEGPVLGEVSVVCADAAGIHLAGPCGPDAWQIEIGGGHDPTDTVVALSRRSLGEPTLVHSTSWRTDRTGVMLTFLAVYAPDQLAMLERRTVGRVDLARGDTDAAPSDIGTDQVLEHALRHLAWLCDDAPVVSDALSPDWRHHLASYVPEPFRALR